MNNTTKIKFGEKEVPVSQYNGEPKMIPASIIPVLAKALKTQNTISVGEIIDKNSKNTNASGVINFARLELLNELKKAAEKGNDVSIQFCQGGIGVVVNGESSFFDANTKIG